jgi:hypothetical protein
MREHGTCAENAVKRSEPKRLEKITPALVEGRTMTLAGTLRGMLIVVHGALSSGVLLCGAMRQSVTFIFPMAWTVRAF